MTEHVYKIIELVGTSHDSFEDAIRTAVGRAAGTVHQLRWFEVREMRGQVVDGAIDHFQVVVRVGFTLEDPRPAGSAGT